eukprot:g28926.t1
MGQFVKAMSNFIEAFDLQELGTVLKIPTKIRSNWQDGVKTALLDFQPVPALDLLCTRVIVYLSEIEEMWTSEEESEESVIMIHACRRLRSAWYRLAVTSCQLGNVPSEALAKVLNDFLEGDSGGLPLQTQKSQRNTEMQLSWILIGTVSDAMPPPLRPKGEHREAPSDERPTLASVFAPPKRKVAPEAIKEDAVRRAVQQGCPTLDEDAIDARPFEFDYLANMAVSLVQDFNDAESLRQELEEGFLPMLEEYEISTEDAQSLCASVLQAAAPSDGPAAELGAVDEAEFLCMFGDQAWPSLWSDISGLPEDLRVVLLRHEAILQGVRRSTKVRDYVQQRNVGEDAASEEDMENALQCMGFETEENE